MKLKNLLKDIRKIHKYQILLKSIHWEPSCFSGHTDMTKLILVPYNAANLLKNYNYIHDKIQSKLNSSNAVQIFVFLSPV
jgi:hypothetical protein